MVGLDLYYPTHAAIVLRRGWGTQVLRDWKKQSQVLRLPLVAQDDRQKEDDVRARKCFSTLESKDDSGWGTQIQVCYSMRNKAQPCAGSSTWRDFAVGMCFWFQMS